MKALVTAFALLSFVAASAVPAALADTPKAPQTQQTTAKQTTHATKKSVKNVAAKKKTSKKIAPKKKTPAA